VPSGDILGVCDAVSELVGLTVRDSDSETDTEAVPVDDGVTETVRVDVVDTEAVPVDDAVTVVVLVDDADTELVRVDDAVREVVPVNEDDTDGERDNDGDNDRVGDTVAVTVLRQNCVTNTWLRMRSL
jgi:hypothetical protein